jgi:hypothetical protein
MSEDGMLARDDNSNVRPGEGRCHDYAASCLAYYYRRRDG